MKKPALTDAVGIIVSLFFVFAGAACQNPALGSPAGKSPASASGLTIRWNGSTASSRTILPANYPVPVNYTVELQNGSAAPITQTGVTSSSWNFPDIQPVLYTVRVTGFDAGGKILVEGFAKADMRGSSSATVSITLNYVSTGSGSGKIHLTFDLSDVSFSEIEATLTLVDPSGTVITPDMTAASKVYSYTNEVAAVGSYQVFFKADSSGSSATRSEILIVVQNVDTACSLQFKDFDFNQDYIAVSSLSFDKTTVGPIYKNQIDVLSPIFNTGASNAALTWSSSDPSAAVINGYGGILIKQSGPLTITITATSVDNPNVSASCVYHIAAQLNLALTYNSNGSTGGTAPVDATTYHPADTVVTAGQGSLVKTGYNFAGWTTASGPSFTGAFASYGGGASFTMNTQSVALYAVWIPDTLRFNSGDNGIEIFGYLSAPGDLTIPPGVSITDSAFEGATGLTSVTLPATSTSIDSCFIMCPDLASFSVDSANNFYQSVSGVLYDKSGKTLIEYPAAKSSTSFTIPSTVTEVGSDSFVGSTALSTVVLPPSLKTINDEAFLGCVALTAINIPEGVTSIR